MTSTFFPAWNASLNAIAATLLLIGYVLVKRRQLKAHEYVMEAAFLVSALFLASYLYYHFNYTSNRFGGQGVIRYVYFTMLISHIILAVLMVPFILRMVWFALTNRIAEHQRLAKWVWPVWMYTSVTGVLVYFFLYQWFPAPAGGT